jgi:hypothetical protein
MVSLDERRRPRRGALLSKPGGEVASAIVVARSAVDARGVRPNAEVTYLQHMRERPPERAFKHEHVFVKSIQATVHVAGSHAQHREPRVSKGQGGADRDAICFRRSARALKPTF